MQHSIVRYQDLHPEIRIDAEYYRREILNRLNVLKQRNVEDLGNLVSFVTGPFGSTVTVDQYVESSQYRYVRNRDISDFRIADKEPSLIPKEVYDALPRFHIRENDLLITVVGTLGKVAIATGKDTRSIFSCKSTIIRAGSINPYFLLTYLNSDTGKLFSLRSKRGAIQEGLNLTDLQSIPVFIPTNGFQLTIEEIIKESFTSIDKSECLFKATQSLLLSELGLSDWQPQHRLTFVNRYTDTQRAGRIDAEYFQPKYNNIVDAIEEHNGGWDTLGNLTSMKKSIEVGSGEYQEEGVPFVRVSNLTPFEITEEKYISQDLYAQVKQHQPEQGEILLSKDGTPGIAHCLREEPRQMIPSGGILRLNRKSNKVNNEFLTLVLNSMLTQEQLNRDVGGSVILHWRPDQIGRTAIPILSEEKQAHIKQRVIESFHLRKQSKHLLECAKRAVEIAIEQDEQTAIDLLKSETKSL